MLQFFVGIVKVLQFFLLLNYIGVMTKIFSQNLSYVISQI